MERQPIPEVRVGDLDIKGFALFSDEPRRLEPGLEAVRVDLFLDGLDDSEPRINFIFRFHE
jgi:hypothetical protein